MRSCDVVVIGSGPGGYVAAIRAAQLGARVVVVEREELGGVCLNWGCIPTKTLIYSAGLYSEMQQAAAYGIEVKDPKVKMPALIARKNEVVKKLKSGVAGLLKAHKIEVIKGHAQVAAPGKVTVGEQTITAKAVIVATGSGPGQLPGMETNGKTIITSTEALDLVYVPKRVVVIGAGALGAEFACIWNAFGAQVTLVEMLDTVLPLEDEELTKRLGAIFKKRGIDVRTKTSVKKVDADKKGVHVELDGAKKGAVEADVVLVGIGRTFHSDVVAKTPSLGVKLGPKGEILVDRHMETNVPGIYAIGDVVGKTLLAHGASAEGLVAATNATGGKRAMDYRVVPACNFTSPEVAHVGLTEKQAREAGVDVKTGRFPLTASGRALAMGHTDGLVKIIGDAGTGEVVGVHIMGAEAGELIASAALAMTMEATVADIAHTIHTHPTLAEAMMEAAEDYLGVGIHTMPPKK